MFFRWFKRTVMLLGDIISSKYLLLLFLSLNYIFLIKFNFKSSECSSVWQNAWFGFKRPRVQLLSFRPHGSIAQLVRAFVWYAKGQKFESFYFHHLFDFQLSFRLKTLTVCLIGTDYHLFGEVSKRSQRGGLENRLSERAHGFESHPLRQFTTFKMFVLVGS